MQPEGLWSVSRSAVVTYYSSHDFTVFFGGVAGEIGPKRTELTPVTTY